MTEQMNVPVLLLHADVILPGGTACLDTDDEAIKEALRASEQEFQNRIALFFSKEQEINVNNLYPVGVFGILTSKIEQDNGLCKFEIVVEARATLCGDIIHVNSHDRADVLIHHDATLTSEQATIYEDMKNKIFSRGQQFLTNPQIILGMYNNAIVPDILCDTIAANLVTVEFNVQEFLEELDFNTRLITLQRAVNLAFAYAETDVDIETKVQKEISDEQKEYYLRKKIKVIQEDLGDIDKASADADELKEKIEAKGMPEDIKKQVLKELKRYKSTNSMSPESTMIRAYLDLMIELPWTDETTDTLDIIAAKEKLDETHFGLEKVKDRILEYLGVKLYTNKNPQTILCLAGPPGVGKTTLAKSIAEALGRKFVKQSMGGVKDEAEIRGHRRTYLGALPGRIINGIKESHVTNPVFLLDEIDKLGADYKGDPSAALLEVLDPAQNKHFMDHYMEVEYDLSNVMFICTANYLENVPAPLRDRMEIIELSSYTELEKFQIGKNYVVKKSLEKNGLEKEKFDITDDAIKYLIKYYTREAGARQLERCMDSLVRKSIKKILAKETEVVHIDEAMVTEMLGKKIYDFNDSDKEDLVGVVNGLAYTQAGGDTLQIEVQLVKGKGNVKLTGKLGDVMKESAEVAHTWVMAHAADYNIDSKMFEDYDVHIHVPEGATPKDGPSAGVTMTTAILSAFTNRLVHCDLGMTGEVTLRGRVLPIGGLKEKSIAAYRTGLKRILIPQENIKDLEDIPQEVKEHLEIIPVSKVAEVIDYALI